MRKAVPVQHRNRAPHKTTATRSFIMKSVRRKNTRPELAVRKSLSSLGVHYRLHPHSLPGTPDIVLPDLKKVIFVHGCFWHGHSCRYGNSPKSNKTFWLEKIAQNRLRDKRKTRQLKNLGWQVSVIWECKTRDQETLKARLDVVLNRASTSKTTLRPNKKRARLKRRISP